MRNKFIQTESSSDVITLRIRKPTTQKIIIILLLIISVVGIICSTYFYRLASYQKERLAYLEKQLAYRNAVAKYNAALESFGGFRDCADISSFAYVGYSYQKKALYVQFKDSGSEYIYYGIPTYEYDNFLNADSMGDYFNKHFLGQYDFEKIS